MEFKFKIGDMVVDKAILEAYRAEATINLAQRVKGLAPPLIMQIVERQSVECPGGTQYFYACRVVTNNEIKFVKFNEVELSAWDRQAWLNEWGPRLEEERAKADEARRKRNMEYYEQLEARTRENEPPK